MVNINTLFEAVCRIINKQAYTAYKDFNRFIVQAELQLFKERLGLPEEYQPGRALPRVAASMTQKVSDDLNPFLSREELEVDATGNATRPGDYARHIATRYIGRKVAVVEPEKLGEYHLDSRICAPTKQFPICVFYPGTIQCHPQDLGQITFEYYRYPRESKWAFVLDMNGRPAYDEALSVHSEFPRDCMNDLVVRVCSFFGISIKANDIAQYAEAKRQQGI